MKFEEKRSIRFKKRFGFNGPLRRRPVEDNTADGLLDTTAHRKELSRRIEPETLGQLDYDPEFLAAGFEPSFDLAVSRWRLRRLAVVAPFWSGVILWLSGYLNGFVGPFSLEGIIQEAGLFSAFGQLLKLALVLLIFGIPILLRGRRTLSAGQQMTQ